MSELRRPETKKRRAPKTAFKPGQSGNPGGQSKEKRAFLDRLRADDADACYAAFMSLVREGNPPAVLRAVEYIAGKPPAAEEDRAALKGVADLPSRAEILAAVRTLAGE